ncbi:MAG: autotransporter domain-containing protein [Alphaproteobacteria bacterium]|nr:autotransporter domain-containing protein [Alphaproteobacteria bacterium]
MALGLIVAAVNTAQAEISITKATYGTLSNPGLTCDATSAVALQCNGLINCSFSVANSLCGDPDYGTVKNIEVIYKCDGSTSITANAEEYTQAALACPNNFNPVIRSNGGGDAAAVNAAENQTAVTTVTATDADGGEPTFSVTGGADGGEFSIGRNSGVLTFNSAPDFERPTDSGGDNTYAVEVTASDADGGTHAQTITVTVTDVAETGTITIVKTTSSAIASDGTFTFASNAPVLNGLSITTIGNTGSSLPKIVSRGNITVTEDEVAGWRLDAISCDGDDSPTYDVGAREVMIDLDDNEVVTCTFASVRDEDFGVTRTQRVIANFLSRRADLITSSEPSLVERLSRRGEAGNSGLPLGIVANGGVDHFRLAFAASQSEIAAAAEQPGGQSSDLPPDVDVWVKGNWAHVDDETRESEFGLLYFGADYLINPSFLVGFLAQLDWMNEKDTIEGVAADGLGWMAGPYVVARLHQNVLFDGRVAWGQSANHVDPLGLYTDDFDTDRWLARGQLTGDFEKGNWRFSPQLSTIYFAETQKGYSDSLGNIIPGQTVSLGRLTFGPEVSYSFEHNGMELEPSFAVKGIWDFDKAGIVDLTTGLPAGSGAALRARVEGGLSLRNANGFAVTGEAFYDGIGADGFESYGAAVRVKLPLN